MQAIVHCLAVKVAAAGCALPGPKQRGHQGSITFLGSDQPERELNGMGPLRLWVKQWWIVIMSDA